MYGSSWVYQHQHQHQHQHQYHQHLVVVGVVYIPHPAIATVHVNDTLTQPDSLPKQVHRIVFQRLRTLSNAPSSITHQPHNNDAPARRNRDIKAVTYVELLAAAVVVVAINHV